MHDVHQHLENERWTKNWVSCASIVLFFNLTSAKMVTGVNSMCVAHSWQRERSHYTYKVSIKLFRCHVTLFRCTSFKMCLFMMKQEVDKFLYCIVHLVMYWHLSLRIFQNWSQKQTCAWVNWSCSLHNQLTSNWWHAEAIQPMDKRGRAVHSIPLPDSVPQGCNDYHAEFHWHSGTVTCFSLWFTVTHSSHAKLFQQNRQKLLSILKYVIFCGKQNILLRGHRDDDKILEAAGSDHNWGNFKAL